MPKPAWIWQAPRWPELTYDPERLAEPLKVARAESGRLFGKAEAITATDLALVQSDVTAWLEWFTTVYADSCRAGASLIDELLLRARFWSDHRHAALNQRQRKVINKMLESGILNSRN
jgi:Fic family protein